MSKMGTVFQKVPRPPDCNFFTKLNHYVKSAQIRRFFLSVFSRIRTKYGKIRTRKNSVFGHFSHIVSDLKEFLILIKTFQSSILVYMLNLNFSFRYIYVFKYLLEFSQSFKSIHVFTSYRILTTPFYLFTTFGYVKRISKTLNNLKKNEFTIFNF